MLFRSSNPIFSAKDTPQSFWTAAYLLCTALDFNAHLRLWVRDVFCPRVGGIYCRQTLPRFTPEAMRANMRIVNILQQFGRTRGMTSSQVALGWLLQKAPYIVPIPGTTKLSHLEENLHTLDFTCSPQEWAELENAVASIPVTGARYNAEQQRQVGH